APPAYTAPPIRRGTLMGNQVARTAGRTTSNKVIPPHERNDRWLTPKPIIDALTTDIGFRRFDLDPCGAPGHDTAERILTLENGDDGLTDPWAFVHEPV